MVDGAADGRPSVVAGRYRVLRAAAGGACTLELHGYDERLGRAVSLEVLRPEWRNDAGLRASFAVAARRAARLQHHHVLRIFDVVSDDGTPAVVTELAGGGTLADGLRSGSLDEAAAQRLTLAVLAALDAAHGTGLLHLDVTPANVLFDEHGTVEVARFGVLDALYRAVRATPGVGAEASADGTDRLVLAVPMARRAPECRAGAEPTTAADLWSVGALVYRALTGSPFSTGDPADAPLSPIASLASLRPGVDRGLAAAVAKALDPRPEHRFASAVEMAAAVAPRRRSTTVAPSLAPVDPAPLRSDDREMDRTGPVGAVPPTGRHAAVDHTGRLPGPVGVPMPAQPGLPAGRGRRRRPGVRTAGAAAGVAAAAAAGLVVVALLHPAAGATSVRSGSASTGADPAGSSGRAHQGITAPYEAKAHRPTTTPSVAPRTGAATSTTTTVPADTVTLAPATDPTTARSVRRAPTTTATTPPTTAAPSTTTTTTTTVAPSTTTTAPPTTTAPSSTTTSTTSPPTTTTPSTTAPSTTSPTTTPPTTSRPPTTAAPSTTPPPTTGG